MTSDHSNFDNNIPKNWLSCIQMKFKKIKKLVIDNLLKLNIDNVDKEIEKYTNIKNCNSKNVGNIESKCDY